MNTQANFITIDSIELNARAEYVWRHTLVGSFTLMMGEITIHPDAVADIAVRAFERFYGDINPADRQRVIDKLSFAVVLARLQNGNESLKEAV